MLVIKILFWIFLLSTITTLVNCYRDHPREQHPASLSQDIIEFILCLWITLALIPYIN